MTRLRAIYYALSYGLRPHWLYEDTPHYAPMTYGEHLRLNLAYALRWLTWRDTDEDRRFEKEKNR